MSDTKRGRKSQANYRELVNKALLSLKDPCKLEDFPVLSQLPVIERWVLDHPHDLLPHGKALRILLGHAVARVIERIGETEEGISGRIVAYLRLRYQQGRSVKEIAAEWSISVEQVWRSAGRRAIDLVTEQFLEIARSSDGEKRTSPASEAGPVKS